MRCMSCVWIKACKVNQFVGNPSIFVSKQSIKIIIKTRIAGKWADNPEGNIKKIAFTMLFAVALFHGISCAMFASVIMCNFSSNFFSVNAFNGERL